MEELESIIQQMQNDGESEENIQAVIAEWDRRNPGILKKTSESDDSSLDLPTFEFNPATQDKTTFNRPVFSLERDGDKNNTNPIPAGDFYDIISEEEDKEEAPKLLKDIQKKEGTFVPEPEITEDFRLPTEEEEELLGYSDYPEESKSVFKMGGQTEGYEKDKEKLEAYLNIEYFTKSQHLKNTTTYKPLLGDKVEGTDNLSALTEKQKGKLLEDFKFNLGELGANRTAFPNLEDYHLDEIFNDVLNAQIRKEKLDIAEGNQYTKINDILTKKEKDASDADAIEEGINRLDNGKINGRVDKNEAKFARIVKKLRTEDLDEETRKKYNAAMDVDTPGSLADLTFNKDEVKQTTRYNTQTGKPEVIFEKTGKRVSKDKKFELYHDPVSGMNYKFGKREADVSERKGGSVVDITDAYQTYLAKFKDTSLDEDSEDKLENVSSVSDDSDEYDDLFKDL